MAGTLKNISDILGDLPDNNAKQIQPSDVRQIVTSSYQPQMILSIITVSNLDVQSAYRCLYYNPYFFEPAGDSIGGIMSEGQIWKFTANAGSAMPANQTITGVEVRPLGIALGESPEATPMVITAYTGSSGELTKYDITTPGRGWIGQSALSYPNSYDGQPGEVYYQGNPTGIEVIFKGPILGLAEDGERFAYTMTTNPNASDFSGTVHSPGQGSAAAAEHNRINTAISSSGMNPLDGNQNGTTEATIYGTSGVNGILPYGPNILNVEVQGQESSGYSQIQVWRIPGA